MNNPDMELNVPIGMTVSRVQIKVEARGWFNKLLWKIIKGTSINCEWEQVPMYEWSNKNGSKRYSKRTMG